MPRELTITFTGESLLQPAERTDVLEVLGKLAAEFGLEMRPFQAFDKLAVTPNEPWEHSAYGFCEPDFYRLMANPADTPLKRKISAAYNAAGKIARREKRLVVVIPDETEGGGAQDAAGRRYIPRDFIDDLCNGRIKRPDAAGPQVMGVYEALLLTSRPAEAGITPPASSEPAE